MKASVEGAMLRRDPVCGVLIGTGQLYFRIAYRSEIYLVCSMECQHAFLLDPDKYARTPGAEPARSEAAD